MKKYYIHNGEDREGPYDIEELKLLNLGRDTQVWYEGLNDWTLIGNVPELKTIYSATPPPFKTPHISEPEKTRSKKRKWVTPVVIAAIGLVLSGIASQSGGDEEEAIATILSATAVVLLLYFIWKAIGGLKIFSILSLIVSIGTIIAGSFIAYIGMEKSNSLVDSLCNYNQFTEILILSGGMLCIVGIYFLAYAITVLASVRKSAME